MLLHTARLLVAVVVLALSTPAAHAFIVQGQFYPTNSTEARESQPIKLPIYPSTSAFNSLVTLVCPLPVLQETRCLMCLLLL